MSGAEPVIIPSVVSLARKAAPAVLLFCIVFAGVMAWEWHRVAIKDLYEQDESVNSTVAANLTHRAFPPRVRVNSLLEEQGHWMEGPYWQHIPPLFAYVPLPLFAIDGRVSIEMKRLAYAIVLLLTGICFIVAVSRFEQTWLGNVSAVFAAIIWLTTPFTRGLFLGTFFGVSDVVLAFMGVICLWALLWYLEQPRASRADYPAGRIALIGAIMALPIVAKSALGLIPATTFFAILLWDQRRLNLKFIAGCLAFSGVLVCCFVPLYLSSPETFWRELSVPMAHTGNFEGWAKPWHYFVTYYLPALYFKKLTIVIYAAFLFSAGLMVSNRLKGRPRTLMALCGGWFVWNLIVASVITSKAPNFIFQSYLPVLFFCVYGPAQWLEMKFGLSRYYEKLLTDWQSGLKWVTPALSVLTVAGFAFLFYEIHHVRMAPYAYQSTHEKFYQFAEAEQTLGADPSDLFILDSSGEDCWFRYYVLFLTGAEARTLNEMLDYNVAAGDVRAKYSRVHFVLPAADSPPEIATAGKISVVNRYRILSFDTQALKPDYAAILKAWVAQSPTSRLHQPVATCNWPPFVAKPQYGAVTAFRP